MNNTKNESFEDAKLWDLPSVDDQQASDDNQTNALNRPRSRWQYEAPEQEEEIKPLTAKDIEEIRNSAFQEGLKSGQQEGFDKGHQEGFEKGKEEGFEVGKQEGCEIAKNESESAINAVKETFAGLIESFKQPISALENEVKHELVLLAVSLAKAVINKEITTSNDVLIEAITQGIKALPVQQNQYQILLNADDLLAVKEHYGEDFLSQHHWQLLESAEISPGGCKIQTSNNAVDVSIERRTQQVFSQLLIEQGLIDDPRAN